MASETAKLKERDEKYDEQVLDWRKSLGPRKKVDIFSSVYTCKTLFTVCRTVSD